MKSGKKDQPLKIWANIHRAMLPSFPVCFSLFFFPPTALSQTQPDVYNLQSFNSHHSDTNRLSRVPDTLESNLKHLKKTVTAFITSQSYPTISSPSSFLCVACQGRGWVSLRHIIWRRLNETWLMLEVKPFFYQMRSFRLAPVSEDCVSS